MTTSDRVYELANNDGFEASLDNINGGYRYITDEVKKMLLDYSSMLKRCSMLREELEHSLKSYPSVYEGGDPQEAFGIKCRLNDLHYVLGIEDIDQTP